ncbi:hypothetical protein GRI39_01870 [Altererythrobacter indicus]|uniref:Uncharacterized protein n=1 Tax=Altericroceibacterium indicum TaxID=374177 RepID=A0A845A6A4_9SPHN|nr:hypothetical protein [Altericroceibacterium indicum]MXP24793.1 hypothetical protein [Altericroceibacterium indicum]
MSRLSLKLFHNSGAGADRRAGVAWAFFGPSLKPLGPRIEGDPLDLALKQTQLGQEVSLFIYKTDASFKQSQAYRDGLSRKEHSALVRRVAKTLRKNGRIVKLDRV